MGRFTPLNWLRALMTLSWMRKSGHGQTFTPFKRSPDVNRRARRRMRNNAIAKASRRANR